MGLLDSVLTGRVALPPRVMLYGTHGIGKSTFGASATGAIMIPTEDGLNEIGCARFPLAKSIADVFNAIGALYTEKHNYQVAVIDTADWCERLIWDAVCQANSVKNIEDIGYAKGYKFALTYWQDLLDGLDALRNEKGMAILMLAHSHIEKFENPETESYDRYTPRLHKSANALLQEWVDAVLFANYRVFTREADEGFGRKKQRGIGDGERIIRTSERPSHLAKNRYSLPAELPMSWDALVAAITANANDTPAADKPKAKAPTKDKPKADTK